MLCSTCRSCWWRLCCPAMKKGWMESSASVRGGGGVGCDWNADGGTGSEGGLDGGCEEEERVRSQWRLRRVVDDTGLVWVVVHCGSAVDAHQDVGRPTSFTQRTNGDGQSEMEDKSSLW